MAFPHKPITNKEEPILVNRPNPRMDKGQMPAYIKELGNPKSTRDQIERFASCPNNVNQHLTKQLLMKKSNQIYSISGKLVFEKDI